MKYLTTKKDRNTFKQAMTHESYNADTSKSNSRYIFLGMFAFRGKVAEVLYKWIPLKGQSLQHILGNHFSESRVTSYFSRLKIEPYVRFGGNFRLETHIHLFVYAYWGWLYDNLSDKLLTNYITQEFLDEKIIDENSKFRTNPWQQLVFLAQMKLDEKVKVHDSMASDLHVVHISAGSLELSSHQSKSKHYARKKAIMKAIKYISDINNEAVSRFLADKESKELEREKEEKEKKHLLFLKENIEKKKLRKERANQLKLENAEKERRRRKAKENIKKAKDRKKENQIVITAGMSAGKRRRLEDKLK